MKKLTLILVWIAGAVTAAAAPPPPALVAVLYNAAIPESRKLAETYQQARGIPEANLVGLELPKTADMSRADYVKLLQDPLRREFEKRKWWRRGEGPNDLTLPLESRICVLVSMRGVPLRIQPGPKPEGFKPDPANPIAGRDEAAVDSELALFGIETMPTTGVLKNQYFDSGKPIIEAGMPFLILTSRIDGASYATCERIIRDSLEAEKTGLWGRAYVDVANKFPQGDQWLDGVAKANLNRGIPTVVDRFNDTFPTNYPMTDVALYHGWYDVDVSGPFLNSRFQFRKGAVAMHLHSFSAQQLNNSAKNWSGPLLEKGAAATIGNVYEPYLHLTHHFDIFQRRLFEGYTLVEAAWMAMPVASWQGIVIGDPLYRPFMHSGSGGEMQEADKDYRVLRMAMEKWGDNPDERYKQLSAAAERTRSGILAEAVGLELLQGDRQAEAAQWFRNAKDHYTKTEDKMRQDFHLIALERGADRREAAVKALRDALLRYGPIPESESLQGWLDILDPPPPPPADPTKLPLR